MTNPLLTPSDLPLFDQIQPDHVAPAIDQPLADVNTALDIVTQPAFPASWTGIAGVLDVATEKLGRAWSSISHLNAVADKPALRAAYTAAAALRSPSSGPVWVPTSGSTPSTRPSTPAR